MYITHSKFTFSRGPKGFHDTVGTVVAVTQMSGTIFPIGSMNVWYTLPKTNIAPENSTSQKRSSLPTINFQGRTVSFRECIYPHLVDFFLVDYYLEDHPT